MKEISDNLKPLEVFGNNYFNSLLTQEPDKIVIEYNKNHLPIGRRKDGTIFYLDISEASRILILGATRCLPLGTLIKTKDDLVRIEEATEVLSFNFDKNIIESKKCVAHNKNKQKILRIKTELGIIECSYNHKFPVKRKGKIIEVEAQYLKKTDRLLKI